MTVSFIIAFFFAHHGYQAQTLRYDSAEDFCEHMRTSTIMLKDRVYETWRLTWKVGAQPQVKKIHISCAHVSEE